MPHESKFLSNEFDHAVLGMERGRCVDVGYAAVLDDIVQALTSHAALDSYL